VAEAGAAAGASLSEAEVAISATAGADTSARIDRGLSATIIAHDPKKKVRCVGQPDAPDFFLADRESNCAGMRSTIASHPADAGISQ
jgi:hypothetical protein